MTWSDQGRSPFVIYLPDGVPMAFPEDTPYEDVVLSAVGCGDGTRIVRAEAGTEIALGEVEGGEFHEEFRMTPRK